jgi:hypothetical protein
VARPKQRGDEVGLREYFLEDAVYLRDTYGPKPSEAWDLYSREADRLIGGEEHSFYRWELPWDHPLRREGSLHDRLVLTKDDRLAPFASSSPKD